MKMKSLKLNILLFVLLFITIANAQSIDSMFINMPEDINPVLNRKSRMEMLINYKQNGNDSTVNSFLEKSVLLKYDSLSFHILIKNTALSLFEMKKFKSGDQKEIIGIIRTFGDSLKSSNITFYNTDWTIHQLKFELPDAKSWFNKNLLINTNIDEKWAENQLSTSFISLSFTSNDLKIEAKNNTYFYLSDETKKTLKPFLTEEPIIFSYKENKWVKAE